MEIRIALCGAFFLALPAMARIDNEPTAEKSTATLDEVFVAGEFPGPGLWKVTNPTADGEHVLWILGAPGPLPKSISWHARDVEKVIAESQEIIGNSSVSITLDSKIGIFKTILLAPSLFRARHNPNGQHLHDVVPAEVYDRWLVQKAKYIGRDKGIESWRPTFAADRLKDATLKVVGGTLSNSTWAVINRVAKENKIKITSPGMMIKIPNDKVKSTVKQFLQTSLPDQECFATTLSMVEALGDTDAIRLRATAWATGDLAALRQLSDFPDAQSQCQAALLNSQVIRDLVSDGPNGLRTNLDQLWLDAIEKALASNRATFTELPISELFNPTGRLSTLRAKGYLIEEPQQSD